MSLSPRLVAQFITIWEAEFGERLDPDEAQIIAGRLVLLFGQLSNAVARRSKGHATQQGQELPDAPASPST